MNKIIHGDCAEVLRKGTANSVDLVCTDPPYGYSFMGKDWDKAVPSVEIWRECLRVLKPGAFAFVMSAPRQDVLSQMIVRLTEAGFDTHFTSIYWTYASGFPKAANIGKMVDKRMGAEPTVVGTRTLKGNAAVSIKEKGGTYVSGASLTGVKDIPITEVSSSEAKALDGSYGGFQPKPAVEIIIVAMKPLSEKTYVDQALKNGKGITWLDDCRIPTVGEEIHVPQSDPSKREGEVGTDLGITRADKDKFQAAQAASVAKTNELGRFPANLICSDDILNDGKQGKARGNKKSEVRHSFAFGQECEYPHNGGAGDSGSYSRFFSLDAWSENLPEHVRKVFPFLAVAKASKREKNAGCENMEERQITGGGGLTAEEREDGSLETASAGGKYGSVKAKQSNFHPTTKPLTLMSYLITLGSRPGETVLDPFLGSGTTACAAKALGRGYIGIEREKEYANIALARVNAVEGEKIELTKFSPEQAKQDKPSEEIKIAAEMDYDSLIEKELNGEKLTKEELNFVKTHLP